MQPGEDFWRLYNSLYMGKRLPFCTTVHVWKRIANICWFPSYLFFVEPRPFDKPCLHQLRNCDGHTLHHLVFVYTMTLNIPMVYCSTVTRRATTYLKYIDKLLFQTPAQDAVKSLYHSHGFRFLSLWKILKRFRPPQLSNLSPMPYLRVITTLHSSHQNQARWLYQAWSNDTPDTKQKFTRAMNHGVKIPLCPKLPPRRQCTSHSVEGRVEAFGHCGLM